MREFFSGRISGQNLLWPLKSRLSLNNCVMSNFMLFCVIHRTNLIQYNVVTFLIWVFISCLGWFTFVVLVVSSVHESVSMKVPFECLGDEKSANEWNCTEYCSN